MLYTNLKHLETAGEFLEVISGHSNVMVICGRMELLCIPVYSIAEELEEEYRHVKIFDMEYDNPESQVIRNLPEAGGLTDIPFIVYFRRGNVVKVTSGIQSKNQIKATLDQVFGLTYA